MEALVYNGLNLLTGKLQKVAAVIFGITLACVLLPNFHRKRLSICDKKLFWKILQRSQGNTYNGDPCLIKGLQQYLKKYFIADVILKIMWNFSE